jgi:hypothetical protein
VIKVETIREFLATGAGRAVSGAAVLVAAVVLFLSVRSFFGGSNAAAIASERTYIDSATGTPFDHELTKGETIPVKAPSGGKTGYPAELCFWTPDGKVKEDPDPVLLNSYVHPESKDSTFCKVCGRLVVNHNPRPQPGDRPPPTSAEQAAARASQKPPKAGSKVPPDARNAGDRDE